MITLNLTPSQARDVRIALIASVTMAGSRGMTGLAADLRAIDSLLAEAVALHAAAFPDHVTAALRPIDHMEAVRLHGQAPNWEPPTGHADYPWHGVARPVVVPVPPEVDPRIGFDAEAARGD